MVLNEQSELDYRGRALVAVAWVLILSVAIFAYWPGLDGPFMLDDFGSVTPLGDYGGVTDWYSFKMFVLGGHAGPTGRPISLLSFLIDANNWPAEAGPFKRTNLVIHLLNGVLLGILTALVLRFLDFHKRDIRWIALVSAAIWLLHPFLVSTTLYVVQRMAQLHAFLEASFDPATLAALRVAHLEGDASTRSYARVRFGAGPRQVAGFGTLEATRALVMDMPRMGDGPVIRDGKTYSAIAHLAEDAAQQALAKAALDLPRLKKAGQFGSWVAAICRNAARDVARANPRMPSDRDVPVETAKPCPVDAGPAVRAGGAAVARGAMADRDSRGQEAVSRRRRCISGRLNVQRPTANIEWEACAKPRRRTGSTPSIASVSCTGTATRSSPPGRAGRRPANAATNRPAS